ncbi:metallo-beta-lactamase domain-containing protein 1-like isoform X2 [Oratosquilla oratoria]|uniref:metallo-beta-lactamase domain-containing protein 1-like isoform X2 n=1 Tax=Oratosquilla oratoria TaxID=337810 RepID=UPI003F75CD9E
MTAWDRSIVEEGVASHGLSCDDIGYAIATHGHSDHLGNLNLFLKAKHIVGFTISYQHEFFIHPFETGEPYKIDKNVEVLPTPGHTTADVSVVVRTQDMGTVVVAGDLFEKEEDIADETIWKYVAGSENPTQQAKHRRHILSIADYIVPGHGPMFPVTPNMQKSVSEVNQD